MVADFFAVVAAPGAGSLTGDRPFVVGAEVNHTGPCPGVQPLISST
ncbi:hypothetical protein [Streptomyces phage phiSAJS1]|nr:hypothetical protein AVT91_p58 [Streptomyces phage phiSAJS1]AXP07826.1 hypothetical protein [Streptomyces phage phiSAJS1]